MIERDSEIRLEISVKTLRRWAREHPDIPILVKGGKTLAGPEVIAALRGYPANKIIRSWSSIDPSELYGMPFTQDKK
jgi:hypothetical protein